MPLDLSIVKRHPGATAGIVVATIVVVYLATRKKPGVTGGAQSSASPELIATSSGTNAAADAYNAQIAVAQIGGQVAALQTNAALQAQENNNQTAISLASITSGATTDQARIVSDAQTQQTYITANAGTETASINADAAKEIATTAANGQVAVAIANASVANNQTAAITSLATTLAAGNKRSSTGVAQIIAAVEGQGAAAVAANQPSAVANSPGAIISSFANPVTKLLGSLF